MYKKKKVEENIVYGKIPRDETGLPWKMRIIIQSAANDDKTLLSFHECY